MKRLLNTPFAMFLCMVMAVSFIACEPEETKIDENEKSLAFLCEGKAIAEGSTHTSSKLDEEYAAMGMTRFVPGINLLGDTDGKVIVTVFAFERHLFNQIATFINAIDDQCAIGFA